tara:strand:+ start:928 stop:1110 length:183 start_codon:yes stop_codon:yes gene_type:complete
MKKVKDEGYTEELPYMVCVSALLASLIYLTVTNLPSIASLVSIITFVYLMYATLKESKDE